MHKMERTLHGEKADEWYCPICGRHIRFEMTPKLKMIVLDSGDPDAVHTGSTGGLSIDATIVEQTTDLWKGLFGDKESKP